MRPRLQFSTGRLLLATAVLAVWVAVCVKVYRVDPRAIPSSFEWAFVLCFGVIPIVLQAALVAVIVKTLAKKSIVAAFFGAVVYVAFIAWVSRVTWD